MGFGRWCTDCRSFEFTLRVSRVYLSDIIGKRADLRVSDRVFGHALRIKIKIARNLQVVLFPRFVNSKAFVNWSPQLQLVRLPIFRSFSCS